MVNTIELAELGRGRFCWYLTTEDKTLLNCALCNKGIREGFYCREIERVVCKDCEFSKDRFCRSKEEEHIHHNVTILFVEPKEEGLR